MIDRLNILSGKSKFVFGFMMFLFVSAICTAFSINDGDDFAIARREILLRRIGHELLLQSGDRTSRVLPIKKITKEEYQISFENALTFQSDSLVNITQRLFSKDPLTSDYIVNVMNCNDGSLAYGFAISENKKDDIVACLGRKQPKACYRITIKFKPKKINLAKNGFILGGLPLLAFVGFVFLRSAKTRKPLSESLLEQTNIFTLGSVLFDAKNRKLIINENTVDLTGTETRVLLIFAQSPNETIERSRLQKEIWEDEGVVVGRSLDMFISKLRKKLEYDPNIKIDVIRGKGYKLSIKS
ncbi:winged helix-turn-helix domain-containing protein [Flavobacterium hercynium]|uniref:Transcriptional regulator n=1 Tax=Flavobacterium hercynium TaxID=387094 RepID=A0A226H2H0_9FLAO|nr:winged helix-turn-helix domain-containing protein [Flavobacterium hercynium]OXA88402.1 transcriptional regulator [Flavobacterium hercynium]SMP30929.1 Transcriptional regulatory protein, C terminal [Flavobacterium hercynium]